MEETRSMARMESLEAMTAKNELFLAAVAQKLGVQFVANPELEKEISRLENRLRELDERRKKKEQEGSESEIPAVAERTAAATSMRESETAAEEERHAVVAEQASETEGDLTSEVQQFNLEVAEENRVTEEEWRKELESASMAEKNLISEINGRDRGMSVAIATQNQTSMEIVQGCTKTAKLVQFLPQQLYCDRPPLKPPYQEGQRFFDDRPVGRSGICHHGICGKVVHSPIPREVVADIKYQSVLGIIGMEGFAFEAFSFLLFQWIKDPTIFFLSYLEHLPKSSLVYYLQFQQWDPVQVE